LSIPETFEERHKHSLKKMAEEDALTTKEEENFFQRDYIAWLVA
jgi:hypothetical protein